MYKWTWAKPTRSSVQESQTIEGMITWLRGWVKGARVVRRYHMTRRFEMARDVPAWQAARVRRP